MKYIDDKYSKNLQKKDVQNYKNRISNFIARDYYKLWFPLDRYRSYNLVYQKSKDLKITDNDTERFFKIFGYIKNNKNPEGYIPDSLSNFINDKTKNITNAKKSTDMMKLDYDIYTWLWGRDFKNAPDYFKKKLLDNFDDNGKTHLSENTMKKKYPEKPPVYNEDYKISRQELFLWFFNFKVNYKLKLNYMDTKQLFHNALCTFEDTYLPEDKILLNLLTNGANFPEGNRDSLDFFLENYKKALGNNYISLAKTLGKSSLRVK